MDVLTAVLAILVAIAILFEVARRLGVPYPTLLVLGGLGLAFVPGLSRIRLDPDLILLVFLPPLLFTAAAESPIRDLRANRAALVRLSIGLVIFTMVIVGAVPAFATAPSTSPPRTLMRLQSGGRSDSSTRRSSRASSPRSARPSSSSAIGARSTTRRSGWSNASSTSKSSGWRAERLPRP